MSENKLVAIVNGKEISRDDVLKFLNDIGPQMAIQFQSPDGIKRVIDELVNQELLYLDARDSNLEDEKEFKEVLEVTKVNLLKDYAVNRIISKIEATEEEMNKYYDENKASFNKAETVVASHILVEDEQKANDIFKEIENGLSFEQAAKDYSSCPSKESGGSLGEFTKGQMVAEFEEVAFKLDENVISDPVKTQFGYHIIKVLKKNSASSSTFDTVKDQVYSQVVRLKQQNKYISKIQELKDKYTVEML